MINHELENVICVGADLFQVSKPHGNDWDLAAKRNQNAAKKTLQSVNFMRQRTDEIGDRFP